MEKRAALQQSALCKQNARQKFSSLCDNSAPRRTIRSVYRLVNRLHNHSGGGNARAVALRRAIEMPPGTMRLAGRDPRRDLGGLRELMHWICRFAVIPLTRFTSPRRAIQHEPTCKPLHKKLSSAFFSKFRTSPYMLRILIYQPKDLVDWALHLSGLSIERNPTLNSHVNVNRAPCSFI